MAWNDTRAKPNNKRVNPLLWLGMTRAQNRQVVVDSALWDPHRWPGATRRPRGSSVDQSDAAGDQSDAIGRGRRAGEDSADLPRCTVVVSRIAEGQDVPKVFSEKIIVNKLVEAAKELSGDVGKVVSLVRNTALPPGMTPGA